MDKEWNQILFALVFMQMFYKQNLSRTYYDEIKKF